MSRPNGSEDDTAATASSRRRFLAVLGTAGTVGGAGCLAAPGVDTARDPTAASTLVATWRGTDPTTSVTLQWLTASRVPPEPATVTLSRTGGGADHRATTTVARFGDSAFYRHRAEPTDLAPDTRYRVGIDGTDVAPVVETAPRRLTEPLTFAEGGDIGTGSAVPRLHDQAARWGPLFGLVGGDLAYANGATPGKWVTFLETWHRRMRVGDRLIPLVAAIGNHEVQSGMHGEPGGAPFFYTLFDNAERDHAYWALDVGEDLSVLVLDSNHTTAVPGTQTEWLEGALAERRERPHLMAAYHVPAYPSAKPIDARDRDDIRRHWVPLFERYGVDVAFEHDDHTYKRTDLLRNGRPVPEDGVRYLGDGAWGQEPRDAKSPEQRPYLQESASRRNVIRVAALPDGREAFRAIDPGGRTIDRFELSATHR